MKTSTHPLTHNCACTRTQTHTHTHTAREREGGRQTEIDGLTDRQISTAIDRQMER